MKLKHILMFTLSDDKENAINVIAKNPRLLEKWLKKTKFYNQFKIESITKTYDSRRNLSTLLYKIILLLLSFLSGIISGIIFMINLLKSS